ncbi:MAG: hypothetical protein QXI02_04125 [Candidatus Caldarchaeum sp.]
MIVVSVRLDEKTFARLLLYWRQRGIDFESRSSLLRRTLEEFVVLCKVRELTTDEAVEVLETENYAPKRQEAIKSLIEEHNLKRLERARALLGVWSSEPKVEELPLEEEGDKDEQTS